MTDPDNLTYFRGHWMTVSLNGTPYSHDTLPMHR
jgi:hypothetical protein